MFKKKQASKYKMTMVIVAIEGIPQATLVNCEWRRGKKKQNNGVTKIMKAGSTGTIRWNETISLEATFVM